MLRTRRWGAKGAQRGRKGDHDCVFAFHDGDEVGPKMLARIAGHTGLKPTDL